MSTFDCFETIEKTDGVVIYTDGSSNGTSAGPTGGGIHGYFYNKITPKIGLGLGRYKATSTGYAETDDGQVTVTQYFDGILSLGKGTNNTAELLSGIMGMRLALVLIKKGITSIIIRADSQYVIDGIMKYMGKWATNNWTRTTGQPIANLELWKEAYHVKQEIDNEKIDFSMIWTESHIGNPGNEEADKNALIGRTLSENNDEKSYTFTLSDMKAYWKADTAPVTTLLRNVVLLFDANEITPLDNSTYYVFSNYGDEANDLTMFGIQDETACYGIVKLNTPSVYINTLFNRQSALITNEIRSVIDGSLYAGAHARQAFSQDALMLYQKQKEIVFTPVGDLNEMYLLGKRLISQLIYPVRMALDGMQLLKSLYILLEGYLTQTLSSQVITSLDITNDIYDVEETPKKIKYKLKDALNISTGKLDLCKTKPSLRKLSVTNSFLLSFGVDMPRREIMAAAAKESPTVTLLYWKDNGACQRAVILKTEEGISIWQNPWHSIV